MRRVWLALLVGCAPDPSYGPAPSSAPGPALSAPSDPAFAAPPEDRAAPSAVAAPSPIPLLVGALPVADPPLPVGLTVDGLSPLYEGWVRDPDALRLLGRHLAALGWTGTAVVSVSWDEPSQQGVITLHVPEADDRSEPLADAMAAGRPVDAGHLGPLLAPLGAYRAALGARFDLRLLAFGLRLSFFEDRVGTRCTAEGGFNDPDGRVLGPCFECLVPQEGRQRICRQGDAWPARLVGSERALRTLESALRSRPLR